MLCFNTCYIPPSFCFSSSSTFKDPERASLRDSGHGDSDQADSDQDTNKGSCCDMSAKEALKLKATGIKPAPLEQGEFSLAISPAAQMDAAPRALGPNDYQLVFFFSVPLELLNSEAATLFSFYFVLCTFLTLCACKCAYLRASERVRILCTFSVYQSRQAHYVFISPTTSASPFSPPSLSTHLWNFDNGTWKMT